MEHASNGRLFIGLVVGLAVLVTACATSEAASKKDTQQYVVTSAELQLELMSYADRYAATVAQAVDDVERMDVAPEVRRAILGDMVFSAAAAFTIAADADPQLALLDLVVMTSLGRMVYEEYWPERLGGATAPVIVAFEKLERDIWNVASPILDTDQQQELRERITLFREHNPELSTFSHLRFADFPSRRPSSTFQKKTSGGIFSSVKNITEQVEQTRILAERAMFLSTRLPLLTGGFADIWTTRLSYNPAVEELRANLDTFAAVSDRLAGVAEQLPETISAERQAAIEQAAQEASVLRNDALEQVFAGIAEERRAILQQLVEEEQRLGGLITELRHTLAEANTLTVGVDGLAQRFAVGEPPPPGVVEEPFDIQDYRATLIDARAMITEANGLVLSANELLNSDGANQLVPSLVEAINQAGETSEGLINHTVIRAIFLIVVFLVGLVIARLCYRWLELRIFGRATAS
jgi:hypothetical protein